MSGRRRQMELQADLRLDFSCCRYQGGGDGIRTHDDLMAKPVVKMRCRQSRFFALIH
jgi:hypothetical protein